MSHAYNEAYLADAMSRLGSMLHYATHECALNLDEFFVDFLISGYSYQFERGNPAVISGKSGVELARDVLRMTWRHHNATFPKPMFHQEKSPEYWTGWALAYYQWASGATFGNIHRVVPVSEICALYPLYHEMDVAQFADEMDRLVDERSHPTNLRRLREGKGLSQSELARASGIGLRSIQMYEQRVNNIDRAQAQAVYKLARALNCTIEDLLENPSQ